MRKLEHTIRVDVTFPHDTSHQVQQVTEDFREFIQLFDQKNREYGSENAFVLGSAGQFADIWRKIGKLKTALWDKKPEQLTSEGTEEIIHDLMGHLFLTLQCLRKEDNVKPRANLIETPSMTLSNQGWVDGEIKSAGIDKQVDPNIMIKKRAEVRRLYPQIGEGSLMAREEESLDWLISAAKPNADSEVEQ